MTTIALIFGGCEEALLVSLVWTHLQDGCTDETHTVCTW